ncbi:hypothetical protein IKP94_00175 [Candidatus Saccharibacteria bacterium]|nr:hypothetical protein [Candidatus Saccharibacteria bacterium]
MKYEGKATRFAELSKLTTLTPAERRERQELHDELYARGFNPKNPDGIVERAIIFDHRTTVKRYCELHERVSHAVRSTDKRLKELDGLERSLKKLGLVNLDRHRLERILGSFEPNKRRADKVSCKKAPSLAEQHVAAQSDPEYDELIYLLSLEAKQLGYETEDEIDEYIDATLAELSES